MKEKLPSAKTREVIITSGALSDNLSSQEKEIVKLYNKSHLTNVEIARKLGIGESTLSTKIRKLGLKRTPQYKYKGYDKKKILELRKLGLSETSISKVLGVAPSTYFRIKQSLGLHLTNSEDQEKSKKAYEVRKYNQKHNIRPECPHKTNILEKYHDEIIDLLEKGIAKTKIAERYNVSIHTVFNFIYLYGIKAPVIKKTDNEKLIIQLFQQGYSQRKIANRLNCSLKILNQKVNQLGLKRDRHLVKKAFGLNLQEDLIKKLYEQGLPGDEIAKQVNAHPVSVYNKIRKMGLTRKNKWAEYRSKQSQYDNKILKLRSSGKTYKEIGTLLGIPLTTVLYRFKRLEGAHA